MAFEAPAPYCLGLAARIPPATTSQTPNRITVSDKTSDTLTSTLAARKTADTANAKTKAPSVRTPKGLLGMNPTVLHVPRAAIKGFVREVNIEPFLFISRLLPDLTRSLSCQGMRELGSGTVCRGKGSSIVTRSRCIRFLSVRGGTRLRRSPAQRNLCILQARILSILCFCRWGGSRSFPSRP
jgi:hypothetical protein